MINRKFSLNFHMKGFIFAALAVIAIIGIFSLMPALLLYFLGVDPRANWNANAIKTECLILNQTAYREECSYDCNCIDRCSWNGNYQTCTRYCQTCYYPCWYGVINVSYTVPQNGIYTSNIRVLDREPDVTSALYDLRQNYPIGNRIFCYYQEKNPTDVSLWYKGYTVYMVFFVIFVVIGGIILIGALIVGVCVCRDSGGCDGCHNWSPKNIIKKIRSIGKKPEANTYV